jgi:hypothetical protein
MTPRFTDLGAEDAAMMQARTAATLVLILLGAIVSDSVLAAGGRGGGGGHAGGGRHAGVSGHGGGGWHGGARWHGGHRHGGGHWHGGSRVSFGLFVGAPFFPYYAAPYYYPSYYYPPYYYPPYYYYPPAVAGPVYSPAYVEQGAAQTTPAQQENWWYYCADAKSYYPYVRECPGGWVRVSPQPPSG